jgi:hypothetical protein
MRDLLDYPLGAVRSAFSTLLGWSAVMAITTFCGAAAPCCIGEWSLAPLWQAPLGIPALAFYTFIFLPVPGVFMVLGALAGTVLGWSLGLIDESFRFRFVIAVVNGAMWAAVSVWLSDNMVW